MCMESKVGQRVRDSRLEGRGSPKCVGLGDIVCVVGQLAIYLCG